MSSGFVTETELAEAQKKRQEESEKVRSADEPLERPEEPLLDSRSLYDGLKEQEMKKDLEYEEAHKLKNLTRGLDCEIDNENETSLMKKALIDDSQKKNEEPSNESIGMKLNSVTISQRGAFRCIGILPGIGRDMESSDSEISTDSDDEEPDCGKYDLFGRKISTIKKKKCDSE